MDEKKKRGPDRKSRQEQIREITDRLEEGVKEVFESDKYREMLKCMSKFHHYSLNNCLLIAMPPEFVFHAELCTHDSEKTKGSGPLHTDPEKINSVKQIPFQACQPASSSAVKEPDQ